jgi:hypothetical protein
MRRECTGLLIAWKFRLLCSLENAVYAAPAPDQPFRRLSLTFSGFERYHDAWHSSFYGLLLPPGGQLIDHSGKAMR